MATTALKATFKFSDADTRAVTFTPFATTSSSVDDFKVNVKQFNAIGVDAMSSTFLSSSGAPCTGISAAEIITTNQTVVYARDAQALARALAEEDSNNG